MTPPRHRNRSFLSVDEVPEEVARVVSLGGGRDSTGMVVELIRRRIRVDAVLFADTGEEKPETYAFLGDHLRPYLAGAGIRYEVVSAGLGRLVDYFTSNRAIPSIVKRDCTSKFKVTPVRRWAIDNLGVGPGRKCAVLLGISSDEVTRIADSDHGWFTNCYPLIGWGMRRDDCVRAIERAELPVPPKSACRMCIFSRPEWFRRLALSDPSYFARARRMEDTEVESRRSQGKTPLHVTDRPLRSIEWEARRLRGTVQRTLDGEQVPEDLQGSCGGFCHT